MNRDVISFKEIEAWCLLFALEESHCGSARTVYDAWFNLLVIRMWRWETPIDDKLRILIAARSPLGELSTRFDNTSQMREKFESLLSTPREDLHRHESFPLACDCLRLSNEERDILRGIAS